MEFKHVPESLLPDEGIVQSSDEDFQRRAKLPLPVRLIDRDSDERYDSGYETIGDEIGESCSKPPLEESHIKAPIRLLGLPIEIFRMIIELVVQDLVIRHSTRLRQGCRTFDYEVLNAYETLCIFASHQLSVNDPWDKLALDLYGTMYFGRDDRLRWRGTWGQPVIHFLARFILCRPYETKLASKNPARHFLVTAEAFIFWGDDRPFDPEAEAWQTCIPCLLNRILDDLKVTAKDRYDSLVELLKHIDDYIRSRDSKNGSNAFFSASRSIYEFSTLFFPRWDRLDYYPLSTYIAVAAMILKKKALYDQVFGAISGAWTCPFLGTPTWAVIRTGQHDLVRHFHKGSDPSSDLPYLLIAAVESGDLATVRFVQQMQEESGEMPPDSQYFEIAITRASQLGYFEIGKHLLKTLAENKDWEIFSGTPPQWILSQALTCCTLIGDLPFLQHLYQSSILFNVSIANLRPNLEILAAWAGDVRVLQWILDHSVMAGRRRIENALSAAIHGNKADSLHFLIGKYSFTSLGTGLSTWPWKILQGVQLKSYKAVCYLLEDRKVIDLMGMDPQDKQSRQYAYIIEAMIQGGHLEMVEMLIRLGLPLNQRLRANTSWTPIMIAHSSVQPGARRIEQRLSELGIERIDLRLANIRAFAKHRRLSKRYYKSYMPCDLHMEEFEELD